MSAASTTIVVGNLTANPVIRYTSSEIPYVRLRLAVNRRTYNAERNDWEDRQEGFYTATAWRDTALHAVQSLHRGDRVVVLGRLHHREWEESPVGQDQPAVRRSTVEIDVEEIGPSLRWDPWQKAVTRPLREVDPAPASALDGTVADPAEEDEEDLAATAVTAAA